MHWESFGRRRLSRRGLLGAASAAALAAAGCSGAASPRTSTVTVSPEPSLPPSRRSATAAASPPLSAKHGSTIRYTGFVQSDGAFDPHRTQAGPFLGQQALTYSRLTAYSSQAAGEVVPDLALSLPEQPEPLQYTFRLNPNGRWHQREPVNGRQVTGDDVKFSIERQRDGDPGFVEKTRWLAIDAIEVPSPLEVVIRLKEPMAPMYNAFAGATAFIVAPEAVEGRAFEANNQVGSGPFNWVEWDEGRSASVSRNALWFGGKDRPYLDGVDLLQPKDADEIEAKLRTRQLDAAFLGRQQADRLKGRVTDLVESTVGTSLFFGMRFFNPQSPYNDVRFRTAVSLAIDRRGMIDRLFGGSGEPSPWVSWPVTQWSLPQSELAAVPGYRPGAAGREADLADARAMLAAYVSERGSPIEERPLFVLEDTEASLGLGSIIRDQLKAALDLPMSVFTLPLGQLVSRMLTGEAPWVAGPDIGPLDLDDWLYPYFHSAGTKNSFAIRDAELDALIVSQRTNLDTGSRREIGYQVQRRLLALNPGMNIVSERLVLLAWPYVRDFPLDVTDGYQHRFADCWLDRNAPAFRGR